VSFLSRLILPAAVVSLQSAALAAVDVSEKPDRVRIEIDGQLFTELRFTGAPHVYYWPVLGPGGTKMTRDWPMENPPGEDHDHVHHRSLWFAHGLVNGVDFWGEDATYKDRGAPKHPVGKIVHEKIVSATSGKESGEVTSSQKWTAPNGDVPLTSVQTLRVYERPANERMCDFEITLKAGAKDVLFGDTKEGSFGFRIAESMRLVGADKKPGAGHILNSAGQADDAAWGQRAKWVEMSGPIAGKTYGVAIFDHPSNLRHPTRWHARDYGLFAANPFCEHEMDKAKAEGTGDYTLPAGQSLTLKYRVWIHEGAADATKLNEQFSAFAKP
jgi:hypothetical protein